MKSQWTWQVAFLTRCYEKQGTFTDNYLNGYACGLGHFKT
jgi:hypothetical protein